MLGMAAFLDGVGMMVETLFPKAGNAAATGWHGRIIAVSLGDR